MNSSFEKYIKAAMDAHQYSVVCEMANVIYPEKNKINMMTYPGKDVRIYKNREDEVQILCPNDITFTQESNITKAISTGTIFEDADEVDKYAGFIVKTKMPIDAMTNKGLENPYKIREMVGSTIGVMNEDGDVDVSDTDVDNGNNVIDDLLKKDSKEFKDVKNVVDDYLGNDSHEFGYDNDFTTDIQQLRDEINNFKDADISPEDSITNDDWTDDWGSATSIMGDHNDAEDERDSDDEPSKAEDNLDVADDDDEDEKNEDDELTQEEYDIMVDPDEYVQEGVINGAKTLHQIGYDPKTKTFITDIPDNNGPGSKMRCKLKLGGFIYLKSNPFTPIKPAGPTFYNAEEAGEPLLYIPISTLLKSGKDLISILKHEEGHFYISTDRANFNRDFANAKKLVDRHSSKLSDHGNVPEEYVADLYSANRTGVENTVAMLKKLGFQTRKDCAKLKLRLNHKWVTRFIKELRKYQDQSNSRNIYIKQRAIWAQAMKKSVADVNDMVEFISKINGFTKAGPGDYAKRLNDMDSRRVAAINAGRAITNDISNLNINVQAVLDAVERSNRINELTYDDWEKMLHQSVDAVHKRIDEFVKANDYEIKARIYFIRKYGNQPVKESYSINPPAYKLRPNQTASFLDADDDINNDTDVSYNMKKECGDGSISSNPSSGGNVNTTMEEDTTTPAPVFSSGPATQTESDEPTEEKDSEKKDEDSDSKEAVAESTKIKEVLSDNLNAAPSDGHNPLLDPIHEGFMLKKPKKLKAIDVRSIVSYVTIEMNDIKDANDQAMLAGYVCSKLELIDFYLTVIDTNDERYVVPHTRQYLVDGQKQLSDLLTKILRIRPINRAQRIWQIEKLI